MSSAKYQEFREKMRQIADVGYSIAVLNWDQETHLPEKGAQQRAGQISTLAGIHHDLAVSNDLGNLINGLVGSSDLNQRELKNIEESKKGYDNAQKYSTAFVKRKSKLTSESFRAWMAASKANDFSLFEPALQNMIDLKREEAELLGYEEHPYDALLDQFEPGEKTSNLEPLFADVRAQLVEFVQSISEKEQVDDKWMFQSYNKDKQWSFGLDLLKQMGYDFKAGRQDLSAHPFTTSFGPSDVRVTTRVNENDFSEMLWSCIHEGGHALYEQGLRDEDYGLPTGSYLSLGIHESQSRLWENNVGRSLPFWKANYSQLQGIFPENLSSVSLEDFYHSMNKVQPSFIRTNADELTYHFHILIRFEIEKSLIEGSMQAKDIPSVWNAKYKEYLNIDVPDDKQGCLQDIHWSHGSLGYFPTYSLGSFYAAQFYNQAKKDIAGLESSVESGNMKPLLNWLRDKVHQHGKLYSAEEMCINITGEKLNFKYFMDYAKEKYGGIYNM